MGVEVFLKDMYARTMSLHVCTRYYIPPHIICSPSVHFVEDVMVGHASVASTKEANESMQSKQENLKRNLWQHADRV